MVQFLGVLTSVAFGSYMVRTVGSDFFGQLTSAKAIISICLVFTSFGWPILLTKTFASGHKTSACITLKRSIADACILTLICTIALFLLVKLNLLSKPLYSFLFLPLLVLLTTFSILAKSALDGLGKVLTEQYVIGIVTPCITALLFATAAKIETPNRLFFTYSYSVFFGFLILLITAAIFAKPALSSGSFPVDMPKRSENWWLMSAGLSNVVLLNTDIIILNNYTNNEIVGIYGIVSSIVAVLAMAISAGNSIYAPIIVKKYQTGDYVAARKTFLAVQKHVLFWSTPLFIVACIFPNEIINLLTGVPTPIDISYCLIILSIAQMVNAATGPVATSLYMKGEIKFFSMTMILSAFLNLIGNIWLVPKVGVIGAATSTAVVIALANITQFLRAKQLKII